MKPLKLLDIFIDCRLADICEELSVGEEAGEASEREGLIRSFTSARILT